MSLLHEEDELVNGIDLENIIREFVEHCTLSYLPVKILNLPTEDYHVLCEKVSEDKCLRYFKFISIDELEGDFYSKDKFYPVWGGRLDFIRLNYILKWHHEFVRRGK